MRPRFSLKALFVLVTLIALGLVFVLWQKRIVDTRKALLSYILVNSGGYAATANVANNTVTIEHRGLVEPFKVDRSTRDEIITFHVQSNSDDPGPVRRWLGDTAIRAIWLPYDTPTADLTATVPVAFPEAQVRQLTSPPRKNKTPTEKRTSTLRLQLDPPPPTPSN